MAQKINPIRPTDDNAISLAQDLLSKADSAALSFLHPETGHPSVSRIAVAALPNGALVSLMSELSTHTKALLQNPSCALLLGEVGGKGDPLTHPRITLHCTAKLVPHKDEAFANLREPYLQMRPKSKLYIDFADFSFAEFQVLSADLNGGFGKAYQLTAKDLLE